MGGECARCNYVYVGTHPTKHEDVINRICRVPARENRRSGHAWRSFWFAWGRLRAYIYGGKRCTSPRGHAALAECRIGSVSQSSAFFTKCTSGETDWFACAKLTC